DSDIVIGKMVGVTRGAPSDLFARSVDRATFDNSALATGLSVHKMFRTSLLRDNGIRFPESKGRALEDQYVMLQAYFAANVVSIVADRVCYWHNRRPDGGNITARRIDPVGYYQAVRENLDLIDAKAPSAEVRDALLRRQFDHEILNRLREPKVLKAPRRFLDKLLREVRKVVVERFPEEFVDTMPATTRARGAAIRRGDLRGLVSLAKRADRVVASGDVVSVEAAGDGVRLGFVAQLAWEDGKPITVQPVRGGGWQIDRDLLPRRLATRPDTDAEVRDVRVTVSARNRDTHVSWFVPVSTEVSLEPAGKGASTVLVRGTADIDLATIAGGGPLDEGSWALAVRVRAMGLKRSRRLTLGPGLDEDDAMALGSDGGLFVTANRGLGVRVQGPARVRA
ncbi:MAG: hypothetical protein JO222_04100, partial [Frankiales bacterium]|nr:hypothetical protein [Frankiales bacterium]